MEDVNPDPDVNLLIHTNKDWALKLLNAQSMAASLTYDTIWPSTVITGWMGIT